MCDFVKFGVLRQAGLANNRKDTFDIWIEETLAQDSLPYHACRSKENHFHLTDLLFSRMGIPKRMRRPSAAREALGFSPLVKARRADTARFESIPFIAALAEPFVFLARRPTT